MPNFFQQLVQAPFLTRSRIGGAYAIAVAADLVQFMLGPLGWVFADELVDIVAMVLIWRLIGFHPFLLPTFVLEFLPVSDMLPTWTGCVFIVVAIRKRQQAANPVSMPPGRVIDV
jgi:hypothetical protein